MKHIGQIQPLDDAVLIRVEQPERLTASKRLFIPDSARRQEYELYQATVIKAGPGALRLKDGQRNPMEVKAGERILFYWAAGELDVTAFYEDGHDYRLISEKSIQGVIH